MRTLDLWFHFVTRDLCVIITFATRKNKTDVINKTVSCSLKYFIFTGCT